MRRGLHLPSGRVIAIGRYMLATLFVLVIWLDVTQPHLAPAVTYTLMAGYVAFSLAIVAFTWDDWWLDAKLAGPAHAIDIVVFTLLAALTEGYASPFLTFFMFLLLSSAIRWGWRATALTALLLSILYLIAGIIISGSVAHVAFRPFAIRTGHLVILSLILIWFGVNQWRSGALTRNEGSFADPALDQSPLETSLRTAMSILGASRGILIWREQGPGDADALIVRHGEMTAVRIKGRLFQDAVERSFLYDLPKDRALRRDESRNLYAPAARMLIRSKAAAPLELGQGIAIPVRTGAGEGELFLEDLPNLSTDHIDLGDQIALDVAAHIDRHALMMAVEESAEARSRLALARDLHDSVVQFLAGAAFRLEALKRDHASGRNLEPELNHLKQMMLQEQGELRSFIAALRSAPKIGVKDLAKDLRILSGRLAKQWNVSCDFKSDTTDMVVPTRLQLEAQHLTREAVANAVRHAGAKTVSIKLRSRPDELLLDFINDGSPYPKSTIGGEMPWTLSERVKLAGGALDVTRGMGVTRISVSLPLSGKLQ
ncbi:histidine kinase [Sphingomonas sp. SM33]|uniref:Histidine kinase n=1 Tax=Sphingomonas telluris TaxID=2907998 RepID=A0ABS9VLD4_9SPHN|nr:histidine kinase [Sphingomonas telluris]